MEATSSNEAQISRRLSVWPHCKHLSTIDPNCLAASLWLRTQGYSYSLVNINRQIPMLLGVYPTLHDTLNNKHYVGFDSIYEHHRTENPSADELALVASFKRLFLPAFMHSQWIDDTNRISFRTLYHCVIGLPTSLFHIHKKFHCAQAWLNIGSSTDEDEQQTRIYFDADRCLSMLENELTKEKHPYITGEKFSLIDAWVSGYLLVIYYHASEVSQMRSLLFKYPHLINYLKRCDEEQRFILTKENETTSLSTKYSAENAMDVASILHIVSQVVSFSIFFFMLTKIGAKSYSMDTS